MLQMQNLYRSSQGEEVHGDQGLSMRNMSDLQDDFVEQGVSTSDSSLGSAYVMSNNNLEEPTNTKFHVDYGANHGSGTGIKIRTRQHRQQPISDNYSTQGTAPRRIRLLMNCSPRSILDDNMRESKKSNEEDEVQSATTEVRFSK